MNKPLSALAGIALLGAAGATGVIVAPLGGEEEVVSQEQETATPTTEDLREGWVRFEHPGTAETPPFSFAHPSEWYLKRTPVPVTLPTGESLGTGVRVDAFNRNPDASPSHPLGPGEVRLEVYVGPWDLYTNCPPDRGLITPLGNGPGERSITPGNPPEIMGSVAVYEITETLCYEAVGYWWSDVPVEDTFDLIRESFRVGQTLISSNDGASPSPPSNEAPTASDARSAFPSEPTPPYS